MDTLTQQFLDKLLAAEAKVKIINVKKSVRDFEGNICESTGEAEVTIQIGNQEYTNRFTITKGGYGSDIILGTPFLACFGILDDLKNKFIDAMSQPKNRQ